MRIVVTGGAGFIGAHLCKRFLDDGHDVLCLDNLVTGADRNVSQLDGPHFTLIHYDVTEFLSIEGSVDYVCHLASPASPKAYGERPIQTLKAGSLGTWRTLGLARAKGARYILASTSEVYGDPQESPQSEAYWGFVNPVGPRSCYDEAKRFAEALVMAYHRFHGVDTRIVRLFNCYGPMMAEDDGRVIPNFIAQALAGDSLTVHGDGSQTRSFVYISDIVEGFCRLMNSDEHEPVNLGNPSEFTIIDFAHIVLKMTRSGSDICFVQLPEDDPKQRCPDISKARGVLGWEPKVEFKDGLAETIAYFRKRAGAL